MKILVIDNYDSFTYNLVQYIEELIGDRLSVFRNDEISIDEVDAYDIIVLSPGPGLPKDAGIMPDLIKRYAGQKAILGVCLGHQAIGEAFGGQLHNLDRVYHGMEMPMKVVDKKEILFEVIPERFMAGRYHSWVVQKSDLPDCFVITAEDEEGRIMAMSHKDYLLKGVQFHPESVMTPYGKKMLANFLKEAGVEVKVDPKPMHVANLTNEN